MGCLRVLLSAALLGLLVGRWGAVAAVVIVRFPAETPTAVQATVPAPGVAPLALTAPDDYGLGQITTTPDDLRHRPAESYRLVLLALFVAGVLPLGLLTHSWWISAQIAARRH